MLYIWLIAENVGNKKRVLMCLGNPVYLIKKVTFKLKKPQSVHSCKIVKHFIEKCNDPIAPCKCLRFFIQDVLRNTESLSKDDIEQLLLEKEKCCGTPVTQHKGSNGSHDWNRVKQIEKQNK